MKTMTYACPAVLLAVSQLTSPGLALDVDWAAPADEVNYLLAPPNVHNVGGIERSWAGVDLTDPGQRDLASFRQEMAQPGRYVGGVNWDALPLETVVASPKGVELNLIGLPFEAKILSSTDEDSMEVIEWEQPPPNATAAGSVSGTRFIAHLDRQGPGEWTLESHTPEGYGLQGFGLVLANSGWNYSGATVAFYDADGKTAEFGWDDGVRFPDHSTDDNFIGYWSPTQISRVQITAEALTILARFDDVALVYVPEPHTLLLLALGSVVSLRRRRDPRTCVGRGDEGK
jgi:hypothetical protein